MAIYVKRRDETASPPQRETGEIDGCKLVSKEAVGRIDDVVDVWEISEKRRRAPRRRRERQSEARALSDAVAGRMSTVM